MPSKKGSIAYENRLARRRAQRAIARLEKELNSGSLERAEQYQKRGQISALKEAIAGTYIGGRGREIRTAEEAQRAARSIVEREYVAKAADRTAQNIQAMQEIGNTYYVDKATKQHIQNPMSSYSEAEMRVFWKSTQQIWNRPNVSKERRYDAIISYVADKEGISPDEVDLRKFIDSLLDFYKNDVAAWQQEIDRRNTAKAAGIKELGPDDVAEFSSEDIVSILVQYNIDAVLEKYRAAYETQEE